MYRPNVGGLDRAIRIALGVLLLPTGLALVGTSGWGGVVTLLGAAMLVSGVFGFCPPYALFGFSTRRTTQPSGARPCEPESDTGSRSTVR